jgi:tRNA pseudouridine55 synthase
MTSTVHSFRPLIFIIIAVNKPTGITSVDVLRTLGDHFNTSSLFAPLIAQAADVESRKGPNQRGRRQRQKSTQVKIGHGGTLDPLATGVLLAGLGSGTKALHSFLACKKTYETVVIFGVETDTNDVLGKVMGQKDWEGVSRENVEAALAKFRGSIKQRPPIFSARHINGERLYDLARRGEPIPEEALKEREVQVDEMELLEYWEEGQHEWVMRSGEELQSRSAGKRDENGGRKRKRGEKKSPSPSPSLPVAKSAKSTETDYVTERPAQDPREIEESDELVMSGALPIPETNENAEPIKSDQADIIAQDAQNEDIPTPEETKVEAVRLGPAARIRMTVSSGFYVRSLCHDLGKTLGSAGVMAELIRTQQADFQLGKNVLEYEDLEKGEDVWGPKVKSLLEQWQAKD